MAAWTDPSFIFPQSGPVSQPFKDLLCRFYDISNASLEPSWTWSAFPWD